MISDILIGKTLEEVKNSTKDTSYEGIFNAVKNNLGMIDDEDILQGSNELKSLKYDDVFIIEILLKERSKNNFFSNSSKKLKIFWFSLKFYIKNMTNDTSLWDIDDFVYSDIPVNIFYKKNNKVVTLYYDDKIFDCLK